MKLSEVPPGESPPLPVLRDPVAMRNEVGVSWVLMRSVFQLPDWPVKFSPAPDSSPDLKMLLVAVLISTPTTQPSAAGMEEAMARNARSVRSSRLMAKGFKLWWGFLGAGLLRC